MTINIVIVEDSTLVRKGLVSIVNNLPRPGIFNTALPDEPAPYRVLADVKNAKELFAVLDTHTPDILLLDYSLDTDAENAHPLDALDGCNLIKYIRKQYKVKILVVSMHHSPIIIRTALDAGAHGYISKNASKETLVHAVQAVIKGDIFVEHHLLNDVLSRSAKNSLISQKEMEVLRHMGKGSRLTEIAASMSLSIKTVSAHKMRVMEKLRIRNDLELYRVISGMAL